MKIEVEIPEGVNLSQSIEICERLAQVLRKEYPWATGKVNLYSDDKDTFHPSEDKCQS